ncbi:hypothetical protein Tco_0114019 [Tanacetum coccineum]
MQTPPSLDYVPGPEYPEYVALSDDEIPVDLEDDPKEDLTGYLADGGDDEEEEESSKDDDDDDEEEASEEDEHEEEKHLALADSDALIAEYASTPTHPSPPPSPLSLLSSPLPRIPSSPLILPPLHTRLTYASAPLGCIAAMTDMPSRKRLCLTALASRFEVGENSTATAAR